MLKGQVLKPWAHSSGAHEERKRREPKKETGSARAQRKARGALARAPPHEVVQSGKLPGSRGGRLKRTWTGSMEAADNHPRA